MKKSFNFVAFSIVLVSIFVFGAFGQSAKSRPSMSRSIAGDNQFKAYRTVTPNDPAYSQYEALVAADRGSLENPAYARANKHASTMSSAMSRIDADMQPMMALTSYGSIYDKGMTVEATTAYSMPAGSLFFGSITDSDGATKYLAPMMLEADVEPGWVYYPLTINR